MPRPSGYQATRAAPRTPIDLRRGGSELRSTRADGAEPLVQTCPRPRLDLAVPRLRLVTRRFEVLEPGIGLLDHEQFLRLALVDHLGLPPVANGRDAREPVGRTRAITGTGRARPTPWSRAPVARSSAWRRRPARVLPRRRPPPSPPSRRTART